MYSPEQKLLGVINTISPPCFSILADNAMKRAYIFNTGCIRRALDSTRIYNYLMKNGWAFTNNMSNADLVIIGTCGTIKKNEDLSLIAIKKITKKISKSARVVVFGCLPNINPDKIDALGKFTLVPTREIDKFDTILNSKVKFKEIPDVNMVTNEADMLDYVLAYRLFRNSSNDAKIKIAEPPFKP